MKQKSLARNLTILISTLALIGVLALAIDMFHQPAAAQTSSPETLTVYLESPTVSLNTGSDMYGQALVTIRLVGGGMNDIREVSFDLLENGTNLRELSCEGAFVETFRWSGHCDTLGFPNANYDLRPRIQMNTGVDALLLNGSGGDAVFGPIHIDNSFTITQPSADGSVFDNIVPISFEASGNAAAVKANIINRDSVSISSVELSSSSVSQYTHSVWASQWDTSQVPSGEYSMQIRLESIDGQIRENLVRRIVIIEHPTTCVPHVTCSGWSVCDSSGQQTRICNDGCGTVTNEQQACTPPSSEPETDSNTIPTIQLIQPGQGSTLSGQTALRAQVSGPTQSVTFFYRRSGTTVDVRIGSAQPSSQDATIWERLWNTTEVPNGSYFVFARVTSPATIVVMSQPPVGIAVQNDITQPSGDNPNPPPAETYTVPPPDNFGSNDTDGDLVIDDEEATLGTDQNNPDTNGDGTSDSIELFGNNEQTADASLDRLITSGTLTADQAADIRARLATTFFEQPTTRGIEAPDTLRITKIDNNFPRVGETQLLISGVGPAHTYVTLFIYSNPIVVTTKTDASGNFVYTLDADLLDGQHQMYVTVTDETGKIREKSTPFAFFIRRAQAVTEEEYLRGDVDVQQTADQPIQNFIRIAVLIVLSLIAALGIGWLVKQRGKETSA